MQRCVSDPGNADQQPGTTNVEANVRNARSSSVSCPLAPGDDGAIGVVAGYEIRRVVKADPNAAVTVAEWDAASASSLIVNDTTASGGGVTIDITGVGPGSTNAAHGPWADGLVPNQSHTLAIAAIDDATDLDAGASHPRLRFPTLRWTLLGVETYDIPRSDGDWAVADCLVRLHLSRVLAMWTTLVKVMLSSCWTRRVSDRST